MLQAIVFDYDGVLADTESLHLRTFQETLGAIGVELTRAQYYDDYLGLDDEAVYGALSRDRGLQWDAGRIAGLVADKARRYREAADLAGMLFPAVASSLREWSRTVDLAVASGSPRHEIEPVLEAGGVLDLLPVIVAAGESPSGKPAPDPYLRALELIAERGRRAGGLLDPARCVAVEDSPWGIEAARAAGLRVVAITTSYDADRLGGADAVVPRFGELSLEMMEKVVARG